MNCVKFISQLGIQRNTKNRIISRYVLNYLKFRVCCASTSIKFQTVDEEENFFKKVIYNEVLLQHPRIAPENNEPICLKYLMPEKNQKEEVKTEQVEKQIVHFPYKTKHEESDVLETFSQSVETFTPSDYTDINVPQWKTESYQVNFTNIENPVRWLLEDVEKTSEFEDVFKFGSCNLNSPISSVPCGGCGALLHCNDPKIPGFIPAELFETLKENELAGEKCQRCHFLKELNVALGMNVSPSEYKKLISSIEDKKALVIMMIDILDFPCSIFPEVFDLIGSTKPVMIVANKVDLLIQDGPWFKKNLKESIMWSLRKQKINLENIIHVGLISAKSGYGVERLISLLFSNWRNCGDIYLVGCTNVGKSSLFNSLIQSDLCKVRAVNMLQRATISPWPGTTLNLLKFPIANPQDWRLIARLKRLNSLIKEDKAFEKFQCIGQKISMEQIPLQELVKRTFPCNSDPSDKDSNDVKPKGLDPRSRHYAKSFWFYDTPGVVHHDQIVNFLTAPELLLTVPKKMLLPRNFLLAPGNSLFIAGLARLDYISGANFVWFTVYASMELPITVTKTKYAEDVYQKFLGTSYFRVPTGGKERLAKWPTLLSKKFEIVGKLTKHIRHYDFKENEHKDTDADIVLSSAGWVSVTAPISYRCKVEAWTPQGRGIYLRDLPVIKRGYKFKGPRIYGTPAFKTVMKEVEVEEGSFTNELFS